MRLTVGPLPPSFHPALPPHPRATLAARDRTAPVRAAPVRVCEERTPGDALRGVVVCSGNANACTGEQGLLEKQERSASVIATSVVRALKIEHWELARMRKAMPEVVDGLMKTVEDRTS